METKKCKWCCEEKDIKYFCQYKTKKGTVLRKGVCNLCYRKKYAPWIKKPLGVNKSDGRFKWKMATYEEKIAHLRLVFESNVIKTDGCWGWNGKLHHSGYAVVKWEKRQIGAHRASYMIYKGKIEPCMFVCHECDNKSCTNPDHLFVGTARENIQDMYIKGKENRNRRKYRFLDARIVKRIKERLADGVTAVRLARDYDVSVGNIMAIKKNKTWKHVKI